MGRIIGRAFGMDVEAPFGVTGIVSGASAGSRSTRIEEVRVCELHPEGRLVERYGAEGRTVATLDLHPERGYVMFAEGWGSFDVALDGSRVRCAPAPGLERWLFDRFLTGQVLPLAAVLQGLEALHASAVVIDGHHTVALAGACRAGKTTIAAHLAAAGAGLLTDDVLTLEAQEGELVCHPGVGAANVRDPDLRAAAEVGAPPFHRVVGEAFGSLRVLIEREESSVRLGSIYFLDHGGAELRFEGTDDPYLLIGHTFNVMIRTPERLERQLDICSHLAASAELFRVSVPDAMGAEELAARLAGHVRQRATGTLVT